MNSDEMQLLKRLTSWHSTPGDEADFLAFLSSFFPSDFWKETSCGYYGTIFSSSHPIAYAPSILVCAHADSPGFIIQSIQPSKKRATAISIGSPHVEKKTKIVIKKTSGERLKSWIYPTDCNTYPVDYTEGLERGDRLCFSPVFAIKNDMLKATFLDNRLGCYQLIKLAKSLAETPENAAANIFLAITTGEEFTGFGASVIAHQVHPDLIICLDATYEAPEQNVIIGGGPVVTLTDKSILLPSSLRSALKQAASQCAVPLQEEIYNFSGTDARAFPNAGISAPVLPLLLATAGNHSPQETGSIRDIEYMHQLLLQICRHDFSLFIKH